jgi:hypothetical protein
MTRIDVWRDTYFRRSGRTTRMLCAAVVHAVWRDVMIVGADARHAEDLKREFWSKTDRFSVEGLSPIGTVNSSMANGWLYGGSIPDILGGEPIFENAESFASHLKMNAHFAFITSFGFQVLKLHSVPRNLVVFVDHYAADAIVEQVLLRGLP